MELMMLAEDALEVKVVGIISGSLLAMGYEVVRVKMQGAGSAKALQIMIERVDGKLIAVEDCEKVSQHVSALLDVEDPISEAYNLEVSSPGVDRPLTRLKDFAKYAGFDIKLESKGKIDGQAKFRGKLIGLDGDVVLMDLNVVDLANPGVPKRVRVDFNNIRNAKLVLTDALMDAFTQEIQESNI
jgi:ribosome maturation factor RimP